MASPKTHRLRSPVLEFPCSRAVRFVWPRILGFQGSWIEFRRLRWVRVQTRKESPAGVGVGGHFGSVNSRWLGKVSPRSFRETYRGETEAGPDDPTTWRKWSLGGLLSMTRSLLARKALSVRSFRRNYGPRFDRRISDQISSTKSTRAIPQWAVRNPFPSM